MRAASLTRLLVAAVACSTLALPASAAPQWGDRGRDDRAWQNRTTGEAYQRGYREGVHDGEEDGRRGRSFNVQNHDDFRKADQGYDRNDGSRDRYRDEFRRGFTEGYRVGYGSDLRSGNRNDRWNDGNGRGPAPAVYRDAAQARGFSDGFKKGVDDRRDNRRFEPQRHKDYREADQGYNGSYGSKDRYRTVYREGFRAGYEDGFQGRFARR